MTQEFAKDKLFDAITRCAANIPKTLKGKVDPAHTAVLIIDMQNDFCHIDGVQAKRGLSISQIQTMVPRLKRFLSAARKYHPLIIFVRMVHTEWSISPVSMEPQMIFPEDLRLYVLEGTWGSEFYEISPEGGEIVVTKYRYSAFQGTDLESILRDNRIKTLVLTGVATPVCVEATAIDGYSKDFFIVLVKDCLAARNVEEHNAALSIMERFLAVTANSKEILDVWSIGAIELNR